MALLGLLWLTAVGLSGPVRVCDPYYGTGYLYRLDLLGGCSEVRFLTRSPDRSEVSFLVRALREFDREHSNMHIRRSRSSDLHDRFLLSEDELVLIGHGLKDLGAKDSFGVVPRQHLEPTPTPERPSLMAVRQEQISGGSGTPGLKGPAYVKSNRVNVAGGPAS